MMNLFDKLKQRDEKIAVIGLGYVGLPLAIEFAKKFNVVGFDVNKEKLDTYKSGVDVTDEVGDRAIQETTMSFTNDEQLLKKCKFHIVAVPTPINTDKTPNLAPIISASRSEEHTSELQSRFDLVCRLLL